MPRRLRFAGGGCAYRSIGPWHVGALLRTTAMVQPVPPLRRSVVRSTPFGEEAWRSVWAWRPRCVFVVGREDLRHPKSLFKTPDPFGSPLVLPGG